jgi:hypothetical protein
MAATSSDRFKPQCPRSARRSPAFSRRLMQVRSAFGMMKDARHPLRPLAPRFLRLALRHSMRLHRFLGFMTLAASLSASAMRSAAEEPAALTFQALSCMTRSQLEAIYRDSAPGTLPSGFVQGKTIILPEESFDGRRSKMANAFWKGKHIDAAEGTFVNQWAIGRAVRGRACLGESWLDGRPSLILDYAGASPLIWRNSRDELREVAPGLYIGFMHDRSCPCPRLKTVFILQSYCTKCP